MAGELTKGLNVLLHPKFTEICQRLDRLEALHKDLTAVVALKEERQEVDHLREHVSSQIKHVDSIIAMNRDKMMSLDELRNREIRALTKTVEQKATLVNVNHLAEQLHATNVTMSSKAENAKLEQQARQLHALSEEVATKATSLRTEELAKQLQALNDGLARKVDSDTTDKITERIQALAQDVATRAEGVKVVDLARKLQELTEETAQKAEMSTVEQLNRRLQAMGEDVAQRAEVRKLEHLGRQLQHLAEEVEHKAEVATTEQAIRQIHALSDAIAQKVEGQAHTVLNDQVAKLREDLLAMRAETSKLDEHSRQLEALSSSVSVNTSRVKHLCLMYASTSGARESEPPTPAATPLPNTQQRQREKLPNVVGQQKPGLVTLPSMAHPPQSAR